MIKLYTAPTPNGHKVSCLLEALDMDYEAILVNLSEGDQDRKSTRLNSSHSQQSRMPSSA